MLARRPQTPLGGIGRSRFVVLGAVFVGRILLTPSLQFGAISRGGNRPAFVRGRFQVETYIEVRQVIDPPNLVRAIMSLSGVFATP